MNIFKAGANRVVFASAGVLIGACSQAAVSEGKPNVLLIIADDIGYGDLSCNGNPVFKTPNLDRLHSQSIRFSQFHAAPMCTPSRAQLMTGLPALQTGASWVGTERTHLRTDLPVMPEIFKASGYRTGMFGKWHLGDNYPMRPQDRGFEETLWFPQQEIGTVNDFWGNDYFDDTYEHNGKREAYTGYCTDVWFDNAMAWMKSRSEQNEPFFCYLALNAAHGPYFVDQSYRDRVKIPNIPKDIQSFFGEIVNVDDNIGRLDAFLEKAGLKDNTILIFMVDNGGTGGYNTYNGGMRGLKTQLWEGGHRVPCFIRWSDGGVKSGDVSELAELQDILPTLIDFCGLKQPDNATFPGVSLAAALRGKEPMPERTLVVQFQRQKQIFKYDACVMRGPWRLVNVWDVDPHENPKVRDEIRAKRYKEVDLQLFNIQQDPHQDRDVAGQYPEVAKELKQYYETWWKQVEPDLEKNGTIVIGNDAENPSFLAPTGWSKVYFTQKDNVLEGRAASDSWNVIVDQDGEYGIELRRWPKESGLALGSEAHISYRDTYTYGDGADGVALPVSTARLRVGKTELNKPVNPEDDAVSFRMQLSAGPEQIQTWFFDQAGKSLGGAYYVYITRL